MNFKNQTILVTASAKRLGRYIAIDLIKDGWDIALHYNNSKVEAEETAKDIIKHGGRVSLHQADLTKVEQVEKLINDVKKLKSMWVGLINNAGLFKKDNGNDFNLIDLNNHMSVNFTAPALLTQALAGFITKNKKHDINLQGIVINILDAKLFGLNPDYYSYTLSKQAMYGLTTMSALSYASSIRVNGIAPGITLPAPGQNQHLFEESHKKNLLKSSSTVEEITKGIKFLLDTKSITGQVTVLDGGAHLAPPRRDVGL